MSLSLSLLDLLWHRFWGIIFTAAQQIEPLFWQCVIAGYTRESRWICAVCCGSHTCIAVIFFLEKVQRFLKHNLRWWTIVNSKNIVHCSVFIVHCSFHCSLFIVHCTLFIFSKKLNCVSRLLTYWWANVCPDCFKNSDRLIPVDNQRLSRLPNRKTLLASYANRKFIINFVDSFVQGLRISINNVKPVFHLKAMCVKAKYVKLFAVWDFEDF